MYKRAGKIGLIISSSAELIVLKFDKPVHFFSGSGRIVKIHFR